MSVTTAADIELEAAKEEIQDAIKNLSEIVVNRCWGWNDFGSAYRAKIAQSLADLIVIRDRLGE